MKKPFSMTTLCLLIALTAAIAMVWGAIHIRQLENTELAIYTQSEYDALQAKYDKALSSYNETSRQLAGYMTRYETAITQLSSARQDISRVKETNQTLTADLETAQAQAESLSAQLETAKTRASAAEKTVRQMNTANAAAALEQERLDKTANANLETALANVEAARSEIKTLNEQIEVLRTFESLSMPLGFTLPEGCGAAEVGGWIYISHQKTGTQAVIRRFETENETDRAAIVDYLMALNPEEESGLEPAVTEVEFEGGAGSRFALQYTDTDGAEIYGEFCVLEVGSSYFCLEVQADFGSRDTAAALADGLMEGMYGKAE